MVTAGCRRIQDAARRCCLRVTAEDSEIVCLVVRVRKVAGTYLMVRARGKD